MSATAFAETHTVLARAGVTAPEFASADELGVLVGRALASCDDRALAKALRREAHRLRQRGVVVPEISAAAGSRPALAPEIAGFVSAVDGRGDRLVWLVREVGGGGLVLLAADINEPEGLRVLHRFDLARKRLRAMRERMLAEGGIRLVPADWRRLDALVVEAADRLPSPVDRRLDYRRLRAEFTTAAPAAPQELTSPRMAAGPGADATVDRSEQLLGEAELRTWWPAPERLAASVDAIAALRDGPLVLTPAQSEAQLATILDRTTRELFPADVTARRLQAVAYVLAETGRLAAAGLALAVADALRRDPERVGEIPLLRTLVQRSIGAMLAAGQVRVRDERRDALVLTPGEIAARATGRSPSHRPRSRG